MSTEKDLTKRQTMILDYIVRQIDAKGYPPSVREIGEAVGLQSTSTVHSHLTQLERKGYIRRDPTKPRAINVLKVNRDMDDFYTELTENQTFDEMVNVPVKLPPGCPSWLAKTFLILLHCRCVLCGITTLSYCELKGKV